MTVSAALQVASRNLYRIDVTMSLAVLPKLRGAEMARYLSPGPCRQASKLVSQEEQS